MNDTNTELTAVVTTIQDATDSLQQLSAALNGRNLLVIGDKKGPLNFRLSGARFFSLDEQLSSFPFSLTSLLPTGHYARKNLGYLLAMREGAKCIYETDDDNAPLSNWAPRTRVTSVRQVTSSSWINVYNLFTDALIWPRGFPLDRIQDCNTWQDTCCDLVPVDAPIQQGLANGSPDVDAIWRLIYNKEIAFNDAASVILPPNAWCPFNSQSTWWWAPAYMFMYLPSYCSFRMTDIWRSFIAQRCLWESGYGLVFHSAEVFQQRNTHNLMRDFTDELPGYNGNTQLVACLEVLQLKKNAPGENLLRCYEALVEAGFFPEKELPLVKAWINDVNGCL